MKRILVIVRESTDRQEIDSQKKEMLDFVSGLGYVEDEIEWLSVQGASARKANKKYLDMIDAIKTKIISKHLESAALWHLNRLGRQEKYLSEMKEWFISNKVQVYVKNPSLTLLNEDKTVNAGVSIAWSVFATMVKLDTDEMFAKTARGKERNKSEGKFCGGKVLYGYQVDSNGYLIPNASEIAIIRLIFELYATGKYSLNKLSKELESRGYTTRKGVPFFDGTLSKMLKNEKYREVLGDVLWDKAAEIRNNNTLKQCTKEHKNVHFAIGLLKCQHCGQNYLSNGGLYVCYRKMFKTRRFESDCTESIMIRQSVLDSIIWDLVQVKHIKYLSKLGSERLLELMGDKDIELEKISHLRANMGKMDERMAKVKDGYYDGDMDEKEYKARIAKLKANVVSIQEEIELREGTVATINQQIDDIGNLDKNRLFLSNVHNVTGESDRQKMKDIVNMHVKLITLHKVDVRGKKATRIDITLKNGEVYMYLYYYGNITGKYNNPFDAIYEFKRTPFTNSYQLVSMFPKRPNPAVECLMDNEIKELISVKESHC